MPFAAQEAELRRLLAAVPIARLSIDRTGLGAHLSENLAREYPQVSAEAFTNEAKERWATDLKILFQSQRISLPRDRGLISEFHGIERKVLPSGKIAFDAPRNSHGHADRFWAIALAVQKERGAASRGPTKIGVRVIG
jgi:phage FluMu gp28-like protein